MEVRESGSFPRAATSKLRSQEHREVGGRAESVRVGRREQVYLKGEEEASMAGGQRTRGNEVVGEEVAGWGTHQGLQGPRPGLGCSFQSRGKLVLTAVNKAVRHLTLNVCKWN